MGGGQCFSPHENTYFIVQVYTPWPANLAALEANLRREVANLDPAMIRRAILDMRSRAHKCIANNGGHIEN